MKRCNICELHKPIAEFYGSCRKCKTCQAVYMKQYRLNSRLDALHAYGGEHPKCACPGCDEDRMPFLSIDHAEGDGARHRTELSGSWGTGTPGGGVIYRWLKKNNYPAGFRVLCFNCNFARGIGPCPVHETISREESRIR